MQFEANQEQQQHDAKFRKMQNALDIADQRETPRANCNARGQIPQNRSEAEPAEQSDRENRGHR